MSKKVYALLAIAGIMVALAPVIYYYLVSTRIPLLPQQREVISEELLVGRRYEPEKYFAELSAREYLAPQPLSWSEHTFLTWKGYGDFSFTFPAPKPDYKMFLIYLGSNFNCTVVREFYKSDFYDFLIENNCYRLRKFVFDTETRSWYATLTLVGHFRDRYMGRIKPPYYVWALVRFDRDGMRVKFYNAANLDELEELKRDIRGIIESHPSVAVAVIWRYIVWYGFFEEASRNGTYIVALYGIDYRDISYNFKESIEIEALSAISESVSKGGLTGNMFIIIEGGEIVDIYSDNCNFITMAKVVTCKEKYEYFSSAAFT